MADGPDLFDKLPERLFQSLRQQVMLGMLPSRKVEELLGPCLEAYENIMPRLPGCLRSDIENILRMYPEIAAKYGVVPKPALPAVLDALWRKLRGADLKDAEPPTPADSYLVTGLMEDIAAETQKPLHLDRTLSPLTGRAYLTTDRGRGVDMEFSYDRGASRLLFRSPGLSLTVHIVLCGRIAATLGKDEPEAHVDLEGLMSLFETDEIPDLELELREEPVA